MCERDQSTKVSEAYYITTCESLSRALSVGPDSHLQREDADNRLVVANAVLHDAGV